MASRSGRIPRLWAYLVRPSRRARTAASRITSGVSKSGSPNSRCTTSCPWRSSSCARSNTSTARNGVISSVRFASSAKAWDTGSAGRPPPAPGDAAALGGAHDLAGDGRGDLLVEHARDDVLLVELLAGHHGGDGLGGGDLHLVGDLRRTAVEQAAEEPREAEHVVDLVGVVG